MTNAGITRRHEVLRFLRAQTHACDVGAVASALGVHPNTARYHLDALCTSGQVSREPAATERPGRPSYEYAATAGMDQDGPRNYELLARVLLAGLGNSSDAQEAAGNVGLAWGAQLAVHADPASDPLDDLVATLRTERFDPQVAEERGVIDLHHCPFLELVAGDSAATVCQVHLGIMRGYLQARESSTTVERLEPFATPDFCRAHLSMGVPV